MYLAADALFIGILATSLCLSFFPKGVTRIALLTLLFPLFSLALCSWMTVFGFYLRLEDIEKRARKRALAQKALERGIYQYWDKGENQLKSSTEFVNLAFEDDDNSNQVIKSNNIRKPD
jgi:hypothetical protein